MKTNEAPKNVYLALNAFGDIIKNQWQFHRLRDDDIEYTRTDAFIEKAKEFIWSHTEGSDYHVNYVLKEFENFMKGE